MALLTGWAGAVDAATESPGLDPAKAITQYVHDSWGTKEGLPNRRVNAIVQTRDGYLWLGTADGLARFDGVRFTIFNSRTNPEIGNNDIRALFEDEDGALWIGTYGGGVIRHKDGRFTRYTTQDGLVHDVVYRIAAARGGGIWVSTGGGFSRLRDGRFTNYTAAQGLVNNRVFPVFDGPHDTTWIGTYGGGLSRLHAGKFTTFGEAQGLGSSIVFDILQDIHGKIWVSTYGGGLLRFDGDAITRFTTKDGLGENRVLDLLEDRASTLWIGTYDGGLSRLRDGRFTTYTKRDGLTDNLVLALYEDREGSLWVGTANGLDRFRNGKVTIYSTAEGLTHDRVYAVYENAAGMWIATEGGGLNRFDQGKFTAITTAQGLAGNNVVSLGGDQAGNLWAGTVDAGMSRLGKGPIANFGIAQGLTGAVYAIVQTRDGDIWVGTSNGLHRWRNGTFTVFGKDAGLGDPAIRSLDPARNGDLWIGTNGGGLSRLRNGIFKTYTTPDGLGGNFVYALYRDHDDVLWIGSKDGGLTRLKDGRFFAFSAPGGLVNESIYQILEDDSGDLWMSGPAQLQRVSKRQLNEFADGQSKGIAATSYGEADGIRSGGFNGGSQPAAWKARDGKLWFASEAGVVVVDPARIPTNRLPPPVYVEQVKVDGRVLALARGVKLPPGKGSFEFDYTALSLVAPAKVRFRYRLAGFDEQWVDAGTRRTAYYTNVPAGSYRFQVIASNNDGVWNTRGDTFEFSLKPVFYRTWWFYTACGALVFLLGFSVHRLRIRQLQLREAELSVLVEERTRELAAANEMLRQISALDELTDIPNRRSFEEKLEREWNVAHRHRWPLSAIMIDIDDFKPFNDGFGHQKGDECLRTVAGALRNATPRAADLVARYGGEEFVVLMPETDAVGALAVAERLRRRVEALAIPHPFARASKIVTISAGVATVFPHLGGEREDLIAQADRRLYLAKSAGRNRTVSSDDT